MSHTERVVILVDMDCFYCQVEEKLNPTLKGKPVAVVQYNQWQGGGIIAVNYEARNRGVTRHMRGKEAKEKCPEIELVRVPNIRGKADISKYREAGKSVAKVLLKYTSLLERASVDEAYLDVTELVKSRLETIPQDISMGQLKTTYTVGGDTIDFLYNLYNSGLSSESNLRLAWGGVIAEEIRAAVYEETGYTCSAGISHNKILAKLSCGLNKPNKQTILSLDSVKELYENLPVRKIKSLGGKFGNTLSEDLGITNMGELIKFSQKELAKRYDEKTASWLYNIARGIDMEPVTVRLIPKSIGCCKKFPGGSALKTSEKITHWLHELALEIVERLEQDYEENNRKAKQMIVSFAQNIKGKEVAGSRTHPLNLYDTKKITNDAFEVIKKNCSMKKDGSFHLTFLGISASKFEDHKNVNEITSFFKVNENVQNDSNFQNDSNSTVDLHEDSSELKFFNEDNSDHDSISEELPSKEQAGSFFLRYFQNFKKPQSPTQRDFNTSRNLVEEELENSDTELQLPSTSSAQDSEREVFVCDKCGKDVPELERTSHSDYHFAMELMKEETEINRTEPKVTKAVPKKDGKKGGSKRKSVEIEQNSTFAAFFKKDQDETGKTEICPQCNKKFHSYELASHLDYHAAKRLHLEINEIQARPIEIVSIKNKTNKVPKQKSNGVRSVKSFFKQID